MAKSTIIIASTSLYYERKPCLLFIFRFQPNRTSAQQQQQTMRLYDSFVVAVAIMKNEPLRLFDIMILWAR